ncbi:DUF1450 domain-containing protein [Anaerobacillus sp. MEB173]|uniref:DUF1450 domain-containing protein n=1 Tax=Anaerobacillus sp. MEB173 TaxID=3383345 RepID=UPI003F900161
MQNFDKSKQGVEMGNKVECCQMNRWNGSDHVFEQLEKEAEIQVVTFTCIGNCHVCKDQFHGVVNNRRIACSTPEHLLETIYSMTGLG